MAKVTCETLVEGGNATTGPPIGPTLGSTGVNLQQVVNKINEMTKQFSGIKVPIKIVVDQETKEFDIDVGVPPTSALIMNKIKISKGSGDTPTTIVGNMTLDQVVEVANAIKDRTSALNLKNTTLSVLGTTLSMGITIEDESPKEIIKKVRNGDFNDKF